MIYDELGAFFAWWYQTRPFMPPASGDVIQTTDVSMSSILYRSGAFQVQYMTYQPGAVGTEHKHPNVDSIFIYACGDLTVTRNDEQPFIGIEPGQQIIRVKPDDWHGVSFGPRGGAFYAIQHWLDGKPGFVLDDWIFRDKNEVRKSYGTT